jgi:hypothetical protein
MTNPQTGVKEKLRCFGGNEGRIIVAGLREKAK